MSKRVTEIRLIADRGEKNIRLVCFALGINRAVPTLEDAGLDIVELIAQYPEYQFEIKMERPEE